MKRGKMAGEKSSAQRRKGTPDVTGEQPATSERTPGRKPDPAREAAILDAAEELLIQDGYERLSFEGVASMAGASRATIYRRWSSKQELVAATLSHRVAKKGAAPDTGSVRGDLVAAISAFASTEADREADLIGGLIKAVRQDSELRQLMRENVVSGQWEHALPIVERGKERGELPDSADHRLLAEVGSALVYQRTLVYGESVDEDFVEHAVDEVLLPLLRV
jgi:AcrR family transcriptional regulator